MPANGVVELVQFRRATGICERNKAGANGMWDRPSDVLAARTRVSRCASYRPAAPPADVWRMRSARENGARKRRQKTAPAEVSKRRRGPEREWSGGYAERWDAWAAQARVVANAPAELRARYPVVAAHDRDGFAEAVGG